MNNKYIENNLEFVRIISKIALKELPPEAYGLVIGTYDNYVKNNILMGEKEDKWENFFDSMLQSYYLIKKDDPTLLPDLNAVFYKLTAIDYCKRINGDFEHIFTVALIASMARVLNEINPDQTAEFINDRLTIISTQSNMVHPNIPFNPGTMTHDENHKNHLDILRGIVGNGADAAYHNKWNELN